MEHWREQLKKLAGAPTATPLENQHSDPASATTAERRARDSDALDEDWSSEQPKLSICLITYNRSRYLEKTLSGFFAAAQLPFRYEVVICDNASTDSTPEVVAAFAKNHPEIRYVRQKENVGPESNYIAAFQFAKGRYSVYLADDDQLLPNALSQIVQYMDANPDVGMCQCPWVLWDDVDKQNVGAFYALGEERVFGKKDALALCDFVLEQHIFPEIYVIRTDVARRMLYKPAKSAFYAFVHLIHALDFANIAFLPLVFYRSITRHWPGESREQNGNQQVLSEWDSYRGGVELMIHRAFLLQGYSGADASQVGDIARTVQDFVNKRMKVALRLLLAKQDYMAAYVVLVRLFVTGGLTPGEAIDTRESIAMKAGIHALTHIYDVATTLERIAFTGVSNAEALVVFMENFRPDIVVVPLEKLADDNSTKDTTLILAGSRSARQAAIKAGYHPGFIKMEQDLFQMFAS